MINGLRSSYGSIELHTDYLFSLRNGFTAYFVLFPENGSFASVTGETLPPRLSASTAAPEPHDFAVRFRRVRLSRHQRPPHLTARS